MGTAEEARVFYRGLWRKNRLAPILRLHENIENFDRVQNPSIFKVLLTEPFFEPSYFQEKEYVKPVVKGRLVLIDNKIYTIIFKKDNVKHQVRT